MLRGRARVEREWKRDAGKREEMNRRGKDAVRRGQRREGGGKDAGRGKVGRWLKRRDKREDK